MSSLDLNQQVDILVEYLVNRPVQDQKIYRLYSIVTLQQNNNKESKLVDFAFNYPVLIPYLDAGLIFIRPESELRRRIYIMFAILESIPEYSDLFLPEKVNILGYLKVVGVGMRAIFRTIIGIIILKAKRL